MATNFNSLQEEQANEILNKEKENFNNIISNIQALQNKDEELKNILHKEVDLREVTAEVPKPFIGNLSKIVNAVVNIKYFFVARREDIKVNQIENNKLLDKIDRGVVQIAEKSKILEDIIIKEIENSEKQLNDKIHRLSTPQQEKFKELVNKFKKQIKSSEHTYLQPNTQELEDIKSNILNLTHENENKIPELIKFRKEIHKIKAEVPATFFEKIKLPFSSIKNFFVKTPIEKFIDGRKEIDKKLNSIDQAIQKFEKNLQSSIDITDKKIKKQQQQSQRILGEQIKVNLQQENILQTRIAELEAKLAQEKENLTREKYARKAKEEKSKRIDEIATNANKKSSGTIIINRVTEDEITDYEIPKVNTSNNIPVPPPLPSLNNDRSNKHKASPPSSSKDVDMPPTDAKSNLMAAIREVGGTQNAGLESVNNRNQQTRPNDIPTPLPQNNDRNALLQQIQEGIKLKKVETENKSTKPMPPSSSIAAALSKVLDTRYKSTHSDSEFSDHESGSGWSDDDTASIKASAIPKNKKFTKTKRGKDSVQIRV